MKEKYIKSNIMNDALICLALVSVALFTNFFYFRTGSIEGAHDLAFHMQRANNLVENLRHLNFNPYINTYSFNQVGSAVASCYPNLVIYIWSIFLLVCGNIVLDYQILLLLTTFIILFSTYYGFLSVFPGKKLEAFIASVSYSSSSLIGFYQYVSGDLAAVWAMGLLPLASAGLYHLIKDNRYKMLTISMSLIFLSHLLNFLLTSIVFALIVVINYDKCTKRMCFSLLKAIGLTILITSVFWIKLLMILISGPIATPRALGLLLPINLKIWIQSAKTFSYNWNLSIIAIVGLFLGVIWCKKLSSPLRTCLVVSLLLVFFSTDFMPWDLFNRTPISIIQWVNRLMVFPELTGCILFAVISLDVFSNKLSSVKPIVFLFVMIIVLGINYKNQKNLYDFSQGDTFISSPWTSSNNLPWREEKLSYKITNHKQERNILFYHDVTDYLPKRTVSVFNEIQYPHRMAIYNNGMAFKVHTRPIPDGAIMKFNANKSYESVELPFVLYNHMYKIWVDGKKSSLKIGAHNLVELKNVNFGGHTVKVEFAYTRLNVVKMISYLMCIAGIVMLTYPNILFKMKN
ncbi:MAG: hypothetical protein Q3959_01570 [Limosilactobacillus sp.]|uniref:hypothetical protein n=1 Tax=Limosilactobacillus sp. TaxID=2773925 RepID=UPI00270CC1D5|nr:hypothetical protein [Limosilactobacillus sp.]